SFFPAPAKRWQRPSAILGIKKRREAASSARDNQLRVKVPALVDSKQPVPDLAFFQERPAHELAQSLFETCTGRGGCMKANLIEAANVHQRAQIPAAESVLVRQGYVER